MREEYFGKYRGVVTNNDDPMRMGRIQVQVPGVLGVAPSSWAMPSVPCNLPKKVGSALPKVGAGVWVEFEEGDPSRPIWTGRWFGNASETPPSLRTSK